MGRALGERKEYRRTEGKEGRRKGIKAGGKERKGYKGIERRTGEKKGKCRRRKREVT